MQQLNDLQHTFLSSGWLKSKCDAFNAENKRLACGCSTSALNVFKSPCAPEVFKGAVILSSLSTLLRQNVARHCVCNPIRKAIDAGSCFVPWMHFHSIADADNLDLRSAVKATTLYS